MFISSSLESLTCKYDFDIFYPGSFLHHIIFFVAKHVVILHPHSNECVFMASDKAHIITQGFLSQSRFAEHILRLKGELQPLKAALYSLINGRFSVVNTTAVWVTISNVLLTKESSKSLTDWPTDILCCWSERYENFIKLCHLGEILN